MLDSLFVQNFKIFKELKVPKLSNVNLFVGKNNTGKSCLLEAVQSYAMKFSNIGELIKEREQDWELEIAENLIYKTIDHPLKYIFYGYELLENEIIISSNKEKVAGAFQPRLDDEDISADGKTKRLFPNRRKNTNSFHISITNIGTSEKNELFIKLDNDNYINQFKAFKDRIELRTKLKTSLFPPSNLPEVQLNLTEVQYASSFNCNNQTISKLWDNINLTDLEDIVIDCLGLIEPSIAGLAFMGNISTRIPVVKSKATKERLSLKTYGDGMTRLLGIILSMVNAKDGIALIDEVENGLHWSVHPKLWEIIFKLSKELNIQVFATSHSLDCVRGFNKIWGEHEEDGCFYRLEKEEDSPNIEAVHYDRDTLNATLITGVEFR